MSDPPSVSGTVCCAQQEHGLCIDREGAHFTLSQGRSLSAFGASGENCACCSDRINTLSTTVTKHIFTIGSYCALMAEDQVQFPNIFLVRKVS